mmetsp:Transcript_34600/g.108686  ORF Transcript_34600/g.108686 Transcript_34600/m.108686 type:complete len:249 (+) Transcript_34600:1075-1821(+)
MDFCRWSYIIFSTVILVSPSRSESLEFSGTIFFVSMVASPCITQLHHFIPSSFSRVICTTLLSTRVHMQSSGLTLECILPSRIRGSPLTPTFRLSVPIVHVICLALTPGFTGTYTSRVLRVCVQVYLSVFPPLPRGGGSLLSSSSSSLMAASPSSSSPSSFAAPPSSASFFDAFSALIFAASSSVTSSIFGCSSSAFLFLASSSCRFSYSISSLFLCSSARCLRSSSATLFFSWSSCLFFCPAFQCFL